jgi:PAS domain S-box-containing protein
LLTVHVLLAVATWLVLLVVAYREWSTRRRLDVEIRERVQVEQALQRRGRYLKALAEVNQLLLAHPGYREVYEGILRLLGLAAGASRVYIFENHFGEGCSLLASRRAEWCAPGILPQIDNPQLKSMELARSACRRWLPLLENDKAVTGNVSHVPPEERELMESQQIQSILVLPMRVDGVFFGFIGFDQCDRPRDWQDSEVYLLQSAAYTLSQHIERRHGLEEIALQRTQLRTFLDNLPGFAFMKDVEGIYTLVNRQFFEKLGVGEYDVLGKTDKEIFPAGFASRYRADDLTVISTGQSMILEELFGREDESEMVVSTRKVPLRDPDGQIIGVTGLSIDISDRKRVENEINQLNTELEERVRKRTEQLQLANEELEAFCYTVSHDLRGPLTGIRGFSQLLLDELRSEERTEQEYVRRVVDITDRTLQLIDDLLGLSRAARTDLYLTPVDLSAMVQNLAAELQLQSPERKVCFHIQEGVFAEGDENLLRVVVQNLVCNAWKYTSRKPQAEIRFGTLPINGETVYYVRDTGAGFRMEYVDRLFQAFNRLHTAHEFPGTGVGLATVRRIIQRHRGRVWAEGEVGQGATFYFTLP